MNSYTSKSGRRRWSVRREGGTTGKTAGCENDEGRTRGRKGSGGYGPGTREREGSTSNHTTNTYTHTTPHIPITAQPQQYHAGSSRTLHTTGRGEARPTGCRSRTGAPCNKGVGDVGTGPNSRTEQNRTQRAVGVAAVPSAETRSPVATRVCAKPSTTTCGVSLGFCFKSRKHV